MTSIHQTLRTKVLTKEDIYHRKFVTQLPLYRHSVTEKDLKKIQK